MSPIRHVSLIAIILIVAFESAAFSQSTTGFPPFSSQERESWDSVNLGNLNVHLNYPVTARKGRGLDFHYALSYDTTVYSLAGTAWFLNFGWQGIGGGTGTSTTISGALTGSLLLSSVQPVTCAGGGSGTQTTYSAYIDPSQTIHSFAANVTTNTCDGTGGTTNTNDGAGYSVQVFGTSGQAIVISRNGTQMSFPASGPPTSSSPSTVTDSNGNRITYDGTTITDTLGTSPLAASGSYPSPFSYQFPNPQGGNSTISVSYVNPAPAIQTAFQCGGILEESIPAGSEPLVDTITLQDGSTYHFTYEQTPGNPSAVTGRLASVKLPTGGTISYQYPGPHGGINCLDGTTLNLTRTTPDGTWTYARSLSGSISTTTVTDPQGNQTVVTFRNPGNGPQLETQRQNYQGNSSGTLLGTVLTCYNGNKSNCTTTAVVPPITEVTSILQLPTGQANERDTFFDSTSGLMTELDEYDFGPNNQPGPLSRKTVFTYAGLGNHILDRVQSVTVCSPSGTDTACNGAGPSGGAKVAQTTLNYDETALTATSVTQHVSVTGSRGNATTMHRWLNPGNTTLNTGFAYDDAGNALTSTDPLGQTTAFSYGDCNGALITTITQPDTGSPAVHHITSASHDCRTGLEISSTDQNGSVTNRDYDAMFRPLTITFPADTSGNRPKTTYTYPDANTIKVQKTITAALNDTVTTSLDGLGRTAHTSHTTPGGTATTDTTYDSLGRLFTVTNPYFSTNDPTYGLVQNQYDALGRTTQITKQDGSAVRISYSGNCITTTDERGNPRKNCSDGLGRLIEVDEPNASSTGTSSTASVTINGSLLANGSALDSGTVSITSDGFTATACFGSSTNSFCSGKPVNNTAAQVAVALATALNVSGSPMSATANGATLSLVWNTPGPFFPGVGALATTHDQPSLFPNPSFTSSATMFDHGTGPSLATNPYVTLYQYDVLDDLLRVDQKGSAPSDSTQWRTRVFTYDSLSRQLTASTPEAGAITYFYDGNDNLLQKVSPSPNQMGPAQHTISYCYDSLNRVNGKAYSWQNCQNGQLPGGTAVVTYAYDQRSNGIGQLTGVTDQAGSATYNYDALGRLLNEQRTNAGISKTMSYTYNLDNSIKTMTYPSSATITDTVDSAGRVLSVVDNGNSINYATSATYAANNALTGFLSGQRSGFNGITNTTVYDIRLQPCRMTASKIGSIPTNCDNSFGELMDLRYRYDLWIGDNGNITQVVNYRDQSRNLSITYDPLNRLSSAQNAGTDCSVTILGGKTKFWGNSYGYDPWGNVLGKTVTKCSSENLSAVIGANNQLQGGYTSDAAGNMTHDAATNLNLTFDPENRLSSAGGFTYVYDADSNRVEKTNGTTGTIYWYMSSGVIAESDLSGNIQSEYVFLNGQRIARRDVPSNTVSYYLSDRLNSATVITDSSGNIVAESEYYPWGGERQITNGDSNHYKFTGLEHDSESNLEHAQLRQLSSAPGRWITPDPFDGSMNLADPQTLNRYSYVGNNPLNLTDPSGLDWNIFSYGLCEFGDAGCNLGTFYPYGLGVLNILPGEVQVPLQSLSEFLRSFLPQLAQQCDFGPCTPDVAMGIAGNPLSVRGKNETFLDCLDNNREAYSIAGVFGVKNKVGKFFLDNDVANIAWGDPKEGAAGLAATHGGAVGFEHGVGNTITYGRRTGSTIQSLNLPKPGLNAPRGAAPKALGGAGKSVLGRIAGWLSGAAELKLAADVALTLAEEVGCALK